MRRCLRVVFVSFSLLASSGFAQSGGESVNYTFDEVTMDDPDFVIGAGIGMYLP